MLVRVCEQCGKANFSDSQFCVKCGQNITDVEPREMAQNAVERPRSTMRTVVSMKGVITDVQIPFRSMVVLVFKFFLASIPTIILTIVLIYVLLIVLRAITVFGIWGAILGYLNIH